MSQASANSDPHALPELAENINIEKYDLSLESVYKHYPIHCLPGKLNRPMGVKAKELQYENIDNLYEPEANMVAFRVQAHKIAPWIKSMAILYYKYTTK